MDTTMEAINNIVNEDTVNIAVEAVEAIPAKGIKLGKLGKAGAIGATVAIIVGGIAVGAHHVKRKLKLKAEQEKAAATGVDNVDIAKEDFEEEPENSADEK